MPRREQTKNEEHLNAARRMLTSLPDFESDSEPFSDGETAGSARSSGSFLPLSDSGDDDPELAHYSGQHLQAKAPERSHSRLALPAVRFVCDRAAWPPLTRAGPAAGRPGRCTGTGMCGRQTGGPTRGTRARSCR